MKLKILIEKIKQKPEFRGISESIIKETLNKHLNQHKIEIEELSERDSKIVIKEIRANLRNLTGQFQKASKNRGKLFEKNKIKEILKTHSSTAERIAFYPKLKKIINSLKAKSILDLGCGLNPIALANSKIKYYASDIRADELKLIQKFFEKNKIKGKTFTYDIRKINPDLPEIDLCILFKVLDVIEKKSHKLSEKILKTVKCRYFLISFATKKLSGKPMRFPQRRWIELLLKRLNYSYKTFKSNNEIFYLVRPQETN